MIFAQIKENVIINTLVIEDINSLSLFKNDPKTGEPFDLILQIDATFPQPGIGWTFDGRIFIAPIESEVE